MRFGGEASPPAFNDDAAQAKAVLAKSMSTVRNATSSFRDGRIIRTGNHCHAVPRHRFTRENIHPMRTEFFAARPAGAYGPLGPFSFFA